MQKVWLISVLMLVIIGCASSPTIEAIKIYRVQWYETRDVKILNKWKTLAEKETRERPDNFIGWFYLGEAYVNVGEQISNIDTMMKGTNLVKKAFGMDSIKVLKQLKQKAGQEAYWTLFKDAADRLIDKKDYKGAKDFLHIAFLILPDQPENFLLQGEVSLGIGDTSEAIRSYKKAIELDPKNPDSYGSLGSIFNQKGMRDSATYYFRICDSLTGPILDNVIKMIAPDRDLKEIRDPVIEASILIEKKMEEEAKKVLAPLGIKDLEPKKRLLNRLTNLRYDIGTTVFEMGLNEYQSENYQTAIKKFQQVLKFLPDHNGARFNLGLIYYQLKKYPEAEKEFSILSKRKLKDYRIWFYLGASIAQQERFHDAIDPFEKALEINPENPDIYRNLALVYSKTGEKNKAYEYFKKAQTLEKGGK